VVTDPPQWGADTIARLANDVKDGDLMWTRDGLGRYWLGQITGPWRFDKSPDSVKFDLYNVRPCRWLKTSFRDFDVPGAVVNGFTGPLPSGTWRHAESTVSSLAPCLSFDSPQPTPTRPAFRQYALASSQFGRPPSSSARMLFSLMRQTVIIVSNPPARSSRTTFHHVGGTSRRVRSACGVLIRRPRPPRGRHCGMRHPVVGEGAVLRTTLGKGGRTAPTFPANPARPET
jgi:hypothetical protein